MDGFEQNCCACSYPGASLVLFALIPELVLAEISLSDLCLLNALSLQWRFQGHVSHTALGKVL